MMNNEIQENSKKDNKNFISGISSIFKKGSNKLSEGFKNIFTKKEENKEIKPNQSKLQSSREEINKIIEEQEKINSQDMFQIEQDEDNKELSFHLKNYDDEEDENDEADTKVNSEEKHKESPKEEKSNSMSNTESVSKVKTEEDIMKLKEENEKIIKEENETDNNTVLHILLLKGMNINLEGLPVIRFSKAKKENKLISFFKKSKREEVSYFALFSENFIYFIKDNFDGTFMKKIGNRYNLKLLSNINIKNQEDGRVMITLSFSKSEFIEINPEKEEKIVKSLLLESKNSPFFMEFMKTFLAKLNKPLQFEQKKK